ncbi:MAG: hypothetical protein HOC09_05785 [Deltaproteobacteria bacterium]|jgi:hypothetical protein|nr:hypothetical protein [Deltaproteobacteria bacterium]
MNGNDQFSLIALWEDLNEALETDFHSNRDSYGSYKSATGEGSRMAFHNIGELITNGNFREVRRLLINIAHGTKEAIEFSLSLKEKPSEAFLRPYSEAMMAVTLLLAKLESDHST